MNPGRPDLRAGFSLPGNEEFGLGLRFWASLRLGFPRGPQTRSRSNCGAQPAGAVLGPRPVASSIRARETETGRRYISARPEIPRCYYFCATTFCRVQTYRSPDT